MVQRYSIATRFSINRSNFTEMRKKDYHILGVMSGTSLDGIDLTECFFSISEKGSWDFKIGKAVTIAYPDKWKQRLREAIYYSEESLSILNT